MVSKAKWDICTERKKVVTLHSLLGKEIHRERQKENNERITIDKEIQYKSHFINEP